MRYRPWIFQCILDGLVKFLFYRSEIISLPDYWFSCYSSIFLGEYSMYPNYKIKSPPPQNNTMRQKSHKYTRRDQTRCTVEIHPKENKNDSYYKYQNVLKSASRYFTQFSFSWSTCVVCLYFPGFSSHELCEFYRKKNH